MMKDVTTESRFDKDDSRQYLQMLQDIINRMANNSANCKTWMLTIFTALTALFAGVESLRECSWLLLVPVVLFYALDVYYLWLECDYRDLENEYVQKLHVGGDDLSMPYNFNYKSVKKYIWYKNLKSSLKSFSTWALYLLTFVVAIVISVQFMNYTPEEKHVQDLESPLHEIVVKQDSIINAIRGVKQSSQNIEIKCCCRGEIKKNK